MVVGPNQKKIQQKRVQLGTTSERQKKLHNLPRIQHEQRYTWPLEGNRVVTQTLTYPKYADASIGDGKIYDDGVGYPHIKNGAIGDGKIYANGVNGGHITSGAVGGSEIASGAVDSGEISGNIKNPSAGAYGLRTLSGGGSTAASASDHTHSSTSFIKLEKEKRREILARRSELASQGQPKGLREAYERIDLLSSLLLDSLSLLLDYEDMTADEREQELEKDKPSTRAYKHMFSVDDGGDQEDYEAMLEGRLALQGQMGPMDKHMRNIFHSHSHTQEDRRVPLRRLA